MIPPSSYFPQKFNLADGPVNEIVTSKGAPAPQVGMNGTDGFWVKNGAGAYVFHAAIDGSLTIAGPLNTTIAASNIVGQLADSQLAALTASKILGQVTNGQIADLAAAKITGQLTNAQIADIAAGKITGTLTNAQIADLAASKITGAIADAQISALSAAKVTGTLSDSQIAALAAAKITGTLTGAQIAALAIGTTHIQGGAITAAKMTVTQLSAITADAGIITAGIIRGAVFETAAADPKVRMDTTGLFVSNATGSKEVLLDTTGLSILTGTSSSPPNSRRIRFLTDDGFHYPTADMFSNGGSNTGEFYLYSRSRSGVSYMLLTARDDISAAAVNLEMKHDPAATPKQRIRVTTSADAAPSKLLLASDGTSDFMFKGETWQALTLLNSWVAYDIPANQQAPQYRKVGDEVQCRGLIKNGTSITAFIAQLPAGYRPPQTVRVTLLSNGTPQYCSVDATGNVQMNGGSTLWVDLTALRFSTAA